MKKTLLILACALVLSVAANARGVFADHEAPAWHSLGLQIQNPQSKIQNRRADSSFEKFRNSKKFKLAIGEMKV